MGRLIYSAICSVDGYIADEDGKFDWAEPDEEVHAFVNELERPVGTYLLGRRTYEVMAVWDTLDTPDQPAVMRDFARLWGDADKIVYSRTLEATTTARTRLAREFDADEVRQLKAAATRDLAIGGPGLGGHAIRAGLVDDLHLLAVPHLVGGGTRAFPDGARTALDLVAERRFDSGVIHVHYRTR